MPRVGLDLPERFPFKTEIDVRPMDVDRSGRLNLQSLLMLMNEARIKFYRSMGYRDGNVEGADTVLADAVLICEEHVSAGDILVFEITAGSFSRTCCDLYCRVTSARTVTEVARAKTAIEFIDPCTRMPVAVPERFGNRFV